MAILDPLFSAANVHNLSQEYSSPSHNCNLRLVVPLALSCSNSSEPSLTVAAKLPVLTASPHPGKISMLTGLGRGLENGSILKQGCHRVPLLLLNFSSCSSTNTSQIILCLWSVDFQGAKMVVLTNFFQVCSCFWGELICPPLHSATPGSPTLVNKYLMNNK